MQCSRSRWKTRCSKKLCCCCRISKDEMLLLFGFVVGGGGQLLRVNNKLPERWYLGAWYKLRWLENSSAGWGNGPIHSPKVYLVGRWTPQATHYSGLISWQKGPWRSWVNSRLREAGLRELGLLRRSPFNQPRTHDSGWRGVLYSL